MKGLIICKGKYGAAEQYANWLSEELQLPVAKPEDISPDILDKYEYLIIGSSVYVGKMLIKDWLRRFEDILEGKKLFFFVVCGTPPEKKDQLEEIARNSIPASLKNSENVFYLRGRMIKSKLSFADRFVLKMGAMLQKDKKAKEEMLTDFDAVDRANLNPLIRKVYELKPERRSWFRTSDELTEAPHTGQCN